MASKNLTDFIWSLANNILRDDIARGKHADFILPFTVLRRLDCVLEPTKDKVLAVWKQRQESGIKGSPDKALYKAAGVSFYNLSPFTFASLVEFPKDIEDNVTAYINGFSKNIQQIFTKDIGFDLRGAVETLKAKNLLYLFVKAFAETDLHPERVSNFEMGTVFEDLIRRFNEVRNENPGEHFTPREVIGMIVGLVIDGDKPLLEVPGTVRSVYDPACGTGGMLSITKDYVRDEVNRYADIRLYGQEVNAETFAIARSDLLMRGDDRDAANVQPGSTLSRDAHSDMRFDYVVSNPPYGKPWKKDQAAVEADRKKGDESRFFAGLPRSTDSQMLFLQHIVSKLQLPEEGGGRAAVITSGSPLSAGDAGGDESEIRRWLFEHDHLDAVIALPEQIFYNTGIPTYVWVLTNRKYEHRRGQVQLIDATGIWTPMKRSLGDKRRFLSDKQILDIKRIYSAFKDTPESRVLPNTAFAYRQITVERPLRMNFMVSADRLERMRLSTPYGNLKEAEREALEELLTDRMPTTLFKNRGEFIGALEKAAKGAGHKLKASMLKAAAILGERDKTAEPCLDGDGNPEPDPALRDYENVPFHEDIDEYFAREVTPFAPDAWLNRSVVDHMDKLVGRVGYEINFNRHFMHYKPPRDLSEIREDLRRIEGAINQLLTEKEEAAAAIAGAVFGNGHTARRTVSLGWTNSIPAHWTVQKLGRMVTIVGGATPHTQTEEYWEGDIPWVSPKDMKVDLIDTATDFISERALAETQVSLIPKDAVLMVVRGMILAHTFPVAITGREVTINQDMKAMVPNEECLPEYLWLFLKGLSPYILSKVEQAAHGTRTLDTDVLRALKVALPGIDEQRTIVADVRQRTAVVAKAIDSISEHVKKLKEYRAALIQEAVTGKIPMAAGHAASRDLVDLA